jgi:chromosome partitioning protein
LDLSEGESRFISVGIGGYFKLKNALEKLESDYDYILIDCPPSLGILTLNALIASDNVMVIVNPEFLSIKGLTTIINAINGINKDLNLNCSILGYLIAQTERTVLSKGFEKQVKDVFQDKTFNTVIRRNVALKEASASKTDIFSYNRTSTGAEDYLELAKEIVSL